MNESCQEFRALWSAWHAGRLDETAAARCASEQARCAACARYDRQMRRLVSNLAALPLPDTPPEVSVAPSTPPARVGRWAVAAGLVVAFTAGVLVASLPWGGTSPAFDVIHADAVHIPAQQVQPVQVAVASPRRISDVEFTIELPEGAELDGYPGQRVVRWKGELAEGRSRLTLPVRATAISDDREIVARIRHANGTRELRVPIDVVPADNHTGAVRGSIRG